MARSSPNDSSRSDRSGFVVGLTGGIGSGKTAVADLFGALGAALVDTDSIAHSITAPGGAAISAIAEAFGRDYLTAEGALDRPRMRQLVFSEPSAKSKLEAILHPRIRELARAQTLAAGERAPYVVLVVPLLVESGTWKNRVDRLLVIDCAQSTQEARVSARSRLDPTLIKGIIAQQAMRSARLDAADDVLVNDGPLAWLAPRVARLHRRYREHARRSLGRL